ncbi:glycine zipper 2TM domain-containing protein [Ramlibacter sp.]|uniref:glycine zipper 2TM domain-containing protein n=1 Tax=Ramlibacter sp. TaxID=1917967 RepID=UPI0039C99ADE
MRSLILLAAVAVLAGPAWADRDDDDDHHGHGKHKNKHKEEYWDGNCKVERKWKHGEYEEKRKCKAPERVVVVQPQPQVVYVYPPWMHRQQNEVAYVPQYQPPQRVVSGATYCHSETVGQVLGGVVGGALGSQIGKGNGRTVATIGGAIAGVLVGGDVGRKMDAGNQACVGQVLEVAPVNHRVQWVEGPSTYVVVPARAVMRQGTYCRPYTVEVRGPYGVQRSNATACRRGDGVWVAA